MEKKDNIWPVIVRYLDNNLSKADSEMLEKWLDEKAENRQTLRSVAQIWKATEEKSQKSLLNELTLKKNWEAVAGRIQQVNTDERKERIRYFTKMRKRQHVISKTLKIAALILVMVTSGFLTLRYAPVQEELVYEPVFREISTQPGERANIDLGDGTNVLLNADSKLIMPDRFNSDRREVELHGQAFFDVKTDRNRPFFIRTDNALVEVIGTSFDLSSYSNDSEVRVVVRDGTVELSELEGNGNKLVVNEGYAGSLRRDVGSLTIWKIDDPDYYFGWLEGRLNFKDTDFTDVIKHIERWYDVRIILELSDKSLLEKKFTSDLKTRSVKDVLEVISVSMNIDYEIDGEDVLIRN